MKRSYLIVISIVACLILSLAVSFAGLDHEPAVAQTAPTAISINASAYVPAGLPVVFSNLAVTSDRIDEGKIETPAVLKTRVTTSAPDQLTGLNLVVYEFDTDRRLRRVDGYSRGVDLSGSRSAEITLELGRRIRAGNRLVLSIERATGRMNSWETNSVELAARIAALIDEAASPDPPVTQKDPIIESSGAALCNDGFRRAMALARAGDRSALTSFRCHQTDRSFSFTFNGKALRQEKNETNEK